MIPTRLLATLLFLASPLSLFANNKEPHDYTEQGTITAVTNSFSANYQIESNGYIYGVSCQNTQPMDYRPPKCTFNGKQLAVGDKIQFRIQKDLLFLPPSSNKQEQQLLILSTELKSPHASPSSSDQGLVTETAQNQLTRDFLQPASRDTTLPSGPVMVTPAGGGAPVLVTPTGPNNGNIMVGSPVTGGPPVTGNQVGGPTANQVGAPPPPQWQHTLHLATADTTYTLACPGDTCQHDGKQIHPGDIFHFELDGKTVRLSADGTFNKKEKFKVLSAAPTQTAK